MRNPLTKFEFASHGYFGPHEVYSLDLETGLMIGRMVTYEFIHPEEIRFQLDADTIRRVRNRLSRLQLPKWADYYINESIIDGEQWSVTATYADGTVIESGGSNDYPPRFGTVKNLFKPVQQQFLKD
ncbi:hypothetical protein LOX54_05990 [Latilactobacillus curvatus]|uniref:hypothetical protein n=1 Tax=Latilactobacillus curvatus TaxID=28038 RepID=UPI0020C79932|nr:hypothetical protein [Latilactobacillus curvatus]MCP8860719.1 hypothetical protein [Latilactobacillus curvatus]MCP8868621.1 hypothetical protein [Latilactobacillus curvatus]MCP8872694.1 hypothetical protein [Latilactobacillus curvatus]MCP8881209.1 hypothetical protein [Latilactobacillus curvatus]